MAQVYEVRPKIWDEKTIIDLFDDGEYSAIWGIRESDTKRSLGVRWNGNNGYVGYPNQGKNPTWYSEPQFLEYAILTGLLYRVKAMEPSDNTILFKKHILIALSECEN